MDNKEPKKNKFVKAFTPGVIVVLLIVDIVLGVVVGFYRNAQVRRDVAAELGEVTGADNSTNLFVYRSVYKDNLSGVVTDIEIQPNSTDNGLQHQLRWSEVTIHIDSDGKDIPVVIDAKTRVWGADKYGNVNSNTLSIGNCVEIDLSGISGGTRADKLIKNISQERDKDFRNMLNKVLAVELIADIIIVVFGSVFVYLIGYSIKHSTRSYIDCMGFVLIVLFAAAVISISIIGSSVKEYKLLVEEDKPINLTPREFDVSYLAFEGGAGEVGSESTREVIATFDEIQDDDGGKIFHKLYVLPELHDYRRFNDGGDVRYSYGWKDYRDFKAVLIGDNEYCGELYEFASPQRALYEFDTFVDFCDGYKATDEVSRTYYVDDDEVIIYRMICPEYVNQPDYYDLVYVRLVDNVIVCYEFILPDMDKKAIDKAERLFKKIGIDADLVGFTGEYQVAGR